MELSVQNTLKNIFELWKKSYVLLFPFTLLSVICFSSFSFSESYILALLLGIVGLYCYNIILLKLSSAVQHSSPPKNIYSIAFKRLPNTLLFFIGLAVLGTTLVGLLYISVGPIFALFSALLLLIFYSFLLFSYPLIVIDNLDPFIAIKKSCHFINRHVWYITGIFLTAGIIQTIFYGIFALVVGLNAGSILYNLVFTTFNLTLSVVVLDSLKKSS